MGKLLIPKVKRPLEKYTGCLFLISVNDTSAWFALNKDSCLFFLTPTILLTTVMGWQFRFWIPLANKKQYFYLLLIEMAEVFLSIMGKLHQCLISLPNFFMCTYLYLSLCWRMHLLIMVNARSFLSFLVCLVWHESALPFSYFSQTTSTWPLQPGFYLHNFIKKWQLSSIWPPPLYWFSDLTF